MIQLTTKAKGYDNKDNRDQFNPSQTYSGLQMTFENGNTISIQFGIGNYCENRFESKDNCKSAEIAIWNSKGQWYDFENDKVKGYCTTDEVAKYIHIAANTIF